MRPATIEYAKGWGYEVTFPDEPEPVEVSEADVESELARRHDDSRVPLDVDTEEVKRRIAEEIARVRFDARRKRRGV